MNKIDRHVFVISDTHLGGTPPSNDSIGTQICSSYIALTEFLLKLCEVAQQNAENEIKTELVINGDFVDFLSEPEPFAPQIWITDQNQVVEKLRRIIKRTEFEDEKKNVISPFEALRRFVSLRPKNRNYTELTIILGNHDIELSLPLVRREFMRLVGAEQGLVKFLYDGEAYVLGDLLIEHGNRFDAFNIVNHSLLRQERACLSRGISIDEAARGKSFFIPPLGSHLVVYIMNEIKKDFPYINLLKPEIHAAIPLAISLVNSLVFLPRLCQSYSSLFDYLDIETSDSFFPRNPQYLGNVEGFVREIIGTDIISWQPNARLEGNSQNSYDNFCRRFSSAKDLLSSAKDLLSSAFNEIQSEYVVKILEKASRFKMLDQKSEDDLYESVRKLSELDSKIKFFILGHTHFPKHIPITKKNVATNACYINSGSWTKCLLLNPDDYDYKSVFSKMKSQEIKDKDLTRLSTFVEVLMYEGQSNFLVVKDYLQDNNLSDALTLKGC